MNFSEGSENVNAKALIGIAMVVFITGGFVFLQLRNRKK
jgi:hypothetical protein